MPLITTFNRKWNKSTPKPIELYNFKNTSNQKIFTQLSTESDFLSSCIDDKRDINSVTNKFINRLDGLIVQSFDKVKMKDRSDPRIAALFAKRAELRRMDDQKRVLELEEVEHS